MRTIIITGDSRGIGLAVRQKLLAMGHQVIGISRNPANAEPCYVPLQLDLAELDQIEHTLNHICNEYSPDGVVLNAGSGTFGSLETFSLATIKQAIELNLTSPLLVARCLLPQLKRQPRSDVIFVGSESALSGGRFGSVYSAAKFGLRGAAQALRHECATANCHVGIVNPGMVQTAFFDALNFRPGDAPEQSLNAKDVADAIVSLLLAPDNAIIEEITVNPRSRVVKKKQ